MTDRDECVIITHNLARKWSFSMEKEIKSSKKFKTVDMAYVALGAVLIALCSWISIPSAVPFTMQTFAVFFMLSA